MTNRVRCACRRCTIRSLMGPAILITLGVLLLLDQWRDDYFSFGNTFPILLIVIGAISLASALAPMDGHIPEIVPAIPPAAPSSGSAPSTPQNRYPGHGAGTINPQ